jgi:hypothetical protein
MSGIARPEGRSAKPFLPVSAWLLLGAAAVHVVVQVLGLGLNSGIRDSSPLVIMSVLLKATSFVLAAAALIGAQGWPAGRFWLLAGAGLFAIAGILDLGLWVWSWAQNWGTGTHPDVTDIAGWWLNAGAAAEAAASAGASLLIAVGLWVARPSPGQVRPGGRALLLGIAIVGLAAATGLILVGISITSLHAEVGTLEYPLLALGVATMTGIALVSVTILPRIGRLPEVSIAVGALLTVAARGAMAWLSFTPANEPRLWMLDVIVGLNGVELVGLLTLAGGLAMGRLVAPVVREARE